MKKILKICKITCSSGLNHKRFEQEAHKISGLVT